jgi:hypothetical protein
MEQDDGLDIVQCRCWHCVGRAGYAMVKQRKTIVIVKFFDVNSCEKETNIPN